MLRLQHVVLSAPRRTGKTSVLDFLAARPSHGFVPIPVFVQDISHPSDFILLMLDLFQEKHPRLFRNLFQASSELIGKAMRSVGEIGVGGFKIQLREKDPDWRNNWKAYGVA